MTSVTGRKKSIVSSAGVQIDQPVANNTLLNKAASQSTSLYQQCSQLRTRLYRIRGFSYYFNLAANADSRQSTDPVTQLWDLFSFGIPLCYIFDLLPAEDGFTKINNSQFHEEEYEANPDKPKKRAIAHFAMQIRTDKVMQSIPGCETFTVTDLWDRNSTDGLVKVINTVTAIVNHLPPDVFETAENDPDDLQDGSNSSSSETPANAQETARKNIIREMVETERKYVQDLEIMQKYSNGLSQGNVIDQDTIHLLFPNLNKLLNFQRKFLIRFEGIAELPWEQQRWGAPFLESEDEFVVYEPYCANYTSASELMLAHEQNLTALNHLINVKGELPALLIKPIQRVCKYPLLLDSLIKATSASSYPHFEELKEGVDAARRIADKINEAQRRAENELTVKNLYSRIEDWKGHHLENFGDLLLDDIFFVTKSDIDREYHVFLFEKIILCCKETPQLPLNAGRTKGAKSTSILKKQATPVTPSSQGGSGQTVKKNTPLLLKGRIFLGNVTRAKPVPPKISTSPANPTYYPLDVWWKGDDDLEFFTLRCRREDQMRQWETQINRLVKESAQRRATDRNGLSRIANSITSSAHARMPSKGSQMISTSYSTPPSMYSVQTSTSATSSRGLPTPYSSDEHVGGGMKAGGIYSGGRQPYTPNDGFEFEPDDDDFEDYPPSSAGYPSSSGRGTPIAARRDNAISLPPERHPSSSGYDRNRAQTEDANGPVMKQWRNGPMPAPPQLQMQHSYSGGPSYSFGPRAHSSMSMNQPSYSSDPSGYGGGGGYAAGGPRARPQLRSQFSSQKLHMLHALDRNGRGSPAHGPPQPLPPIPAPPSRSRSASQPAAYVPKPVSGQPPVPVPNDGDQWGRERSNASAVGNNKRGSGSSESTGGESSDYSPNSSSPVTPFGSSESSLGGVGFRTSRSHYVDPMSAGMTPHIPQVHGPPVKVKVHFHEDIFVIQVAMFTEYEDLVQKVGKKIRLCGPRRDDGPLRVKYLDEDGDMVMLGSTEDVQMAFEQYRPGGQVTLFVT